MMIGGAYGQAAYPPAVQFESLMNMRFYEANGGFLVEDIQIVFPPASVQKAALVVDRAGGGAVATVPLRLEKMEFPAFARFRPASGQTGNVRIGQPGSYVMSVVVDGKAVTEMPFTLEKQTSADPFSPGSSFVRSGPWADLAYFTVVPGSPDGEMTFNWWMSQRELPGGSGTPKVTWHLMHGGKEIAAARGPVVPSTMDWYFYSHKQMEVPSKPRGHWLTLADVQALSGDVSVVLKANGTPFKTYRMKVSSGQIERMPQNALTYEPHTAFISPRFIDTSSGSNSSYKMYEMFWLRAAK